MNDVRIDKWLWAVRVFKTRTLAAEACKAGHVKIAGLAVRAARSVRVGEIIEAQVGEIHRTVKVLGLLENRVGAQLAREHMEDLTPEEEYQKRREPKFIPVFVRPKGAGRPTKKDRRQMVGLSEREEPPEA
ncbi:MAG TPA: RNA-binding S4 domain-containing protein [Methylomirabilota bacterium]|nr:RNA-binding S4 domain-containing protein [Methylomirabilota bacterium]